MDQKITVLFSVRKTERKCAQTSEHKELAMCPSPHIWCAGAGSGLGRRSDQPNEISQHTKCLSGPIRIPSCLPWVYLIDGKQKEQSLLWVGSLVPRVGLGWVGSGRVGLVWVGLGWTRLGSVEKGWLWLGLPSTVTPQSTCFYSLPPTATGFSRSLAQQSRDSGMLSLF